MALSWWDTFSAIVGKATRAEFEAAFRKHHVPAGIIHLKEEEFHDLTQGANLLVNTFTGSQSLPAMRQMM
jgi:hypothetical protein